MHIYYDCVVPGMIQNLVCAERSSPSELSFSWEQPTVLGNEVVGYQVTVNRLEHRTGTREVVQSSVYDDLVETKGTSVSGLGKDIVVMKREHASYHTFMQLVRFPTTSQ